LQICDAVKIERDILTAYNSSLTTQLNAAIAARIGAETERDNFKSKSKKRGKVIAVLIAAEILKDALILLIR